MFDGDKRICGGDEEWWFCCVVARGSRNELSRRLSWAAPGHGKRVKMVQWKESRSSSLDQNQREGSNCAEMHARHQISGKTHSSIPRTLQLCTTTSREINEGIVSS